MSSDNDKASRLYKKSIIITKDIKHQSLHLTYVWCRFNPQLSLNLFPHF